MANKPVQPTSPNDLPDDMGLLKAMLWEVLQSNDELVQQVAWLKRALWGQKSEKVPSPDQLALFEEAKKRLGLVPNTPGDEEHEMVEPTDTPPTDPVKPTKPGAPPRMPVGPAKTRRGGKREITRGAFLGGTVPLGTPYVTNHVCLDGAACRVCGKTRRVCGSRLRAA